MQDQPPTPEDWDQTTDGLRPGVGGAGDDPTEPASDELADQLEQWHARLPAADLAATASFGVDDPALLASIRRRTRRAPKTGPTADRRPACPRHSPHRPRRHACRARLKTRLRVMTD
jgi:hypothetical protein